MLRIRPRTLGALELGTLCPAQPKTGSKAGKVREQPNDQPRDRCHQRGVHEEPDDHEREDKIKDGADEG